MVATFVSCYGMFILGLYFLRFLGRRVKFKFSSPYWKRKSFLVYLLIYSYNMVNLFIYLNLLYHFLEFVFVFIFLFLWSFFYSVKSKCGGTLALRLFEYHFNWGLFISVTSVHSEILVQCFAFCENQNFNFIVTACYMMWNLESNFYFSLILSLLLFNLLFTGIVLYCGYFLIRVSFSFLILCINFTNFFHLYIENVSI